MNFNNGCIQSTISFTAVDLNNTGITSWTWVFDDGTTAFGNTSSHTYNNTGIFPVKLVALNSAGCLSDTLTNGVIVYSTNANAGRDTTVTAGQSVRLNGSGGISYSWTPIQYLNNPNIPNPTAILNSTQTFTLRAYTPEGCESFARVTIYVNNTAVIYLPNAFTPNGDGLNSIYKALPIGIKEFKYLKIFNRFGEEVFYNNDYSKGWDGTWKGAPQGNGVFVVMASGVDFRGNIVNSQGTLILLR